MKKLIVSKSGFTLVEMIVVISIIALISTIMLTNYRGGQKESTLQRAAQQVVSDLRRAQNMAISTKELGTTYGYGVYFNSSGYPTSYILFADADNDKYYDIGEEVEAAIELPTHIQINSVSPSPVHIFFLPPDPTTFINADSTPGVSSTITLKIEDVAKTKTVTVNTAGLIEVD